MINPLNRVRLIGRDDPAVGWQGYHYMQVTPAPSSAVDQAAGAQVMVWIFFDDVAVQNSFLDFGTGDMSGIQLFLSVLTKPILFRNDDPSDLLNLHLLQSPNNYRITSIPPM